MAKKFHTRYYGPPPKGVEEGGCRHRVNQANSYPGFPTRLGKIELDKQWESNGLGCIGKFLGGGCLSNKKSHRIQINLGGPRLSFNFFYTSRYNLSNYGC